MRQTGAIYLTCGCILDDPWVDPLTGVAELVQRFCSDHIIWKAAGVSVGADYPARIIIGRKHGSFKLPPCTDEYLKSFVDTMNRLEALGKQSALVDMIVCKRL